MKLLDLFEARRYPNHPAQQLDRVPNRERGLARRSTMERLEKYKDRDDVYISFTDLPKAGLNPASNYDTPIGVYCYPLKYYYERALKYYDYDEGIKLHNMDITKVIPYAGDRSFLYVLESKEPLPDVSEYSETDWNRDYKKLQEIVGDRRAKKIFDMALREFKFDFSSNLPFISNLWSVLGFVSNYHNFINSDYVPDHEIPDFMKSRKETVRKSVFLKRLGYYGFSDKTGLSVIHPNEPVQAFFLSTNDFKVIDKMELSNYRTNHHNKVMKVSDKPHSHIYRFIKKIKKFGNDYEGIAKYVFDNKLGHNLKYLPDEIKSFNLVNELELKYFGTHQLHTFFNSTLPTKTQIDLFNNNPELLFQIVYPTNISEEIINNLDKITDRELLKSTIQTLIYGGVNINAAQQINTIKDDVTRIKCIPAGFRKLEALQYMVKHAENDIERKTLIKMICLDERHTEFEEWLIDNYFDLVPFKLFSNSGNSYAFRKNPKKYISMVPFNDMPWDIQDMVKKYEDK